MKKIIFILLLIFSAMIEKSYAQPSQIQALPMQYNPSFAGAADKGRLSSNFSISNWSMGNNKPLGILSGNAISYDQFISKIGTGVGVSFSHDMYHQNIGVTYKGVIQGHNTSISAAISPKISFKGKFTLAPSLQIIKYVNYNDSKFDTIGNNSIYGTQVRSGILLNSDKLYAGYTAILYNPSFTKTPHKKISNHFYGSFFQAGYVFQRNPESKRSFAPAIVLGIYKFSRIQIKLLQINLNFKFNKFICGLGGGIMIGYQNNRLKIMYVQDLGINPYSPNSFGNQTNTRYLYNLMLGPSGRIGGQLSLRYLFNTKSGNASIRGLTSSIR
jgi:hypothetical protein